MNTQNKPKTFEEHQQFCERMGNIHLEQFQRARISMAEALKVAKEVYPNSTVLDEHARGLHSAGKSAEAQGFVVPWLYEVGTFFYLAQENGRAVYVPWCFWDDTVTKLGTEYSEVAHAAIARANRDFINEAMKRIIQNSVLDPEKRSHD